MMIYVFTCRYYDEVERFKKLLDERGAHFESVQTIAFRNIWGGINGGQYAILYQHNEPLCMEVKC